VFGAEDVQLTSLVQSSVVPSLKLQVAVSWTAVPLSIEGFGGSKEFCGATTIEVSVGVVTVTVVEPDTVPRVEGGVAVIVTGPAAMPFTSPLWFPELPTAAVF
jgi:hypothetical protein